MSGTVRFDLASAKRRSGGGRDPKGQARRIAQQRRGRHGVPSSRNLLKCCQRRNERFHRDVPGRDRDRGRLRLSDHRERLLEAVSRRSPARASRRLCEEAISEGIAKIVQRQHAKQVILSLPTMTVPLPSEDCLWGRGHCEDEEHDPKRVHGGGENRVRRRPRRLRLPRRSRPGPLD